MNIYSQKQLDLLFRVAYFCFCLLALGFGMFSSRRASYINIAFLPFIIWAIFIIYFHGALFSEYKQLFSLLTWIVFFAACLHIVSWRDYPLLYRLIYGAVVVNLFAGILSYFIAGAPMPGTFTVTNRFRTGGGGQMLNALVPYIASMLIFSSLTVKWKWYRFFLGLALFSLGTAGLYRGALLGFIMAMLCIIMLSHRGKIRLFVIILFFSAIMVIVFGDMIITRMRPSVRETSFISTSGRLEHWPFLFEKVKDSPIVGHGPNADVYKFGFLSRLVVAHNDYLSFAVNYGVPGMIMLYLPLIWMLFYLFRYRSRIEHAQYVVLNGIGSIVIILVMAITSNVVRTPGSMVLLMLPVAVAFTFIDEHSK